MKTTPGTVLDDLPGSLPPDEVPKDVDLEAVSKIAQQLVSNVSPANLIKDAFWRDLYGLTGHLQTYNGASAISKLWKKTTTSKDAQNFSITNARANTHMPETSWVVVDFSFTTTQENGLVGNCSGKLGLVPVSGGQWKIWFITTVLENFEGYGNPDQPVLEREVGNSLQLGENEFQVVLVGAGQNGLSHAGRFQSLGIKYVLLERLPGVGQSWTTKYDTVRQHTIREYNNLPFDRTWKKEDGELLPAAIVTSGFENYATKYNLNVWTSTDLDECKYNSKTRRWTLEISRNDGSGEKRTLTCEHLGLALGAGVSQPNRPQFPGEDRFKGDLMHMKYFKNSKKWKDKRGIVIGSGTAGHDIAQDMLDNGLASVTMIQRKKTAIYPIDWVIKGQEGLFNMNIPTEVADRMQYAMPQKIGGELQRRSWQAYLRDHKDYFSALEKAGFKLDNDQVLIDQIFSRYGGYYIDVGTSKHIANGNIKVKSGVEVSTFTEHGISFTDGTELQADLIVLATGYEHDYRKQVATVVGNDIAEQLGDFWGLTKDGDVRGVLQEAAPGLWLLGGTLGQARFWSRFVALQLQAEMLGKPLVTLHGDAEGNGHLTNGSTVNGVH